MFLPRRGLGATGAWFCALGLMLASAGCEPASITDAHNQLARGPARIVSLVIPIIDTTETPGEFLGSDTVTTPQGLLGIKVDSQNVTVGVGDKLRFNSVTATRSEYDIPAGVLSSPGTHTQSVNYTPLSLEPRLTAIDTVVADSGVLVLTTFNRLPVSLAYSVTLNGFTGSGGAVLTATGTVPAAPGDGSYDSSTVTFNLAGVTITPPTANTDLSFTFTVPGGGISPTSLGDSAVIQSGTGVLVVRRLEGSLDPTKTPELTVAVADSQQIDSTQFNFGDLQDGIDSVTLNDAQVRLTLSNASGAPVVLSNFVLKTDSAGTAITVAVADSGATTLTLARGQIGKVVTLQAGRLLNAVVHQALAGGRPAIVAMGTATVGDGQPSTIRNSDQVSAGLGLTVGLDFTVPSSGITFGRYGVEDGADWSTANADQVAQHVDTAGINAVVTNGTAFGVEVGIALVPDSVRNMPIDSAFMLPGRVELGPVSVAAGTVDTQGRVTAAVVDTARLSLTGAQSRVLLGKTFTAFVRITLLPSPANPRGAIRPTDTVGIHASGTVKLRSGGAP
jgi:hypothetical protein